MFSSKSWILQSFAIIVVSAMAGGYCGIATCQEFKIESQVYTGDSTLPVAQNITLFSQDLVYDFELSNESPPRTTEIIIYDSHQHKVVLIDPVKSTKLEMHDLRVLKFLEGVRRSTEQDNRSKFLVTESFTEEADFSSGWVSLTSPTITYRFRGKQPATVSLVPRYLYYLDASTRLAATDPHQVPPFAKMKLNQSIRQRGWIPSEVQVSVQPNSLFRDGFEAKVKRILTNGLSKKDRERIAEAKSNWLQFESISLADYRGYSPSKESLLDRIRGQKNDPESSNAADDMNSQKIKVVDFQQPLKTNETKPEPKAKMNQKLEPIVEKK